mgnify:CR=1 FL=1
MTDFAEYLVHLRSISADPTLINTTKTVFDQYTKWLNSGSESEPIVDHLERLFGRTRPLYIEVATLNGMMYQKAPKGHVSDAMLSLGFVRAVHTAAGIQTRMWIRGEWDNDIRAYQPTPEVPPCPVPPPLY